MAAAPGRPSLSREGPAGDSERHGDSGRAAIFVSHSLGGDPRPRLSSQVQGNMIRPVLLQFPPGGVHWQVLWHCVPPSVPPGGIPRAGQLPGGQPYVHLAPVPLVRVLLCDHGATRMPIGSIAISRTGGATTSRARMAPCRESGNGGLGLL